MLNTEKLKLLNIHLSADKIEKFEAYKKIFLEYNAHTNLISKKEENFLFEKHIFDSLAINLFPKFSEAKNLLDIGTGGGFPAVPIAIAFPQINVLGVDSVGKKIRFISSLAKELNLTNIKTLVCRTENLPVEYLESFDIVTSRAVAPLNTILEYAAPYLKINGFFAAYKSKNTNEELKNAQNAMKILNCSIETIVNYNLPLTEQYERNLIIFKKEKATCSKFPRKEGTAKSNPL